MKTPSRRQEERSARLHGGTRNAGSGNGWARKGDVRTTHTLVENKLTGKSQLTLKASVLDEIHHHAWAEGRTPVVEVELGGRSYVVLELGDYLELMEGYAAETVPASVGEPSQVPRI